MGTILNCMLGFDENRNSLTWALPTLSVCQTFIEARPSLLFLLRLARLLLLRRSPKGVLPRYLGRLINCRWALLS
jgi:hypothetical protein